MKSILSLSILFCFGKTYGQSITPKITHHEDLVIYNVNDTVGIEFRQNKKTNLLVVLTDNTGHTVFLDNRHNFIGSYKQKFVVAKKGEYLLKVIDDAAQMSKTFIMK